MMEITSTTRKKAKAGGGIPRARFVKVYGKTTYCSSSSVSKCLKRK